MACARMILLFSRQPIKIDPDSIFHACGKLVLDIIFNKNKYLFIFLQTFLYLLLGIK